MQRRRLIPWLRGGVILQGIRAIALGAATFIFFELVWRYHDRLFRSTTAFTLFHAAFVMLVTIAIIKSALQKPNRWKSWQKVMVTSIGVFGSLAILLLVLSEILLEPAPQSSLVVAWADATCLGIWLLSIFVVLLVGPWAIRGSEAARRSLPD
jgi:uncharacterized protein YhhL (DUF1145 family)